MQGAIAESRRLELRFADQMECLFSGLADASSGLRSLFAGVRPDVDHRLDDLDAVIAVLRRKLDVTRLDVAGLDRESFAPLQQMLLGAFAELQSTIARLASEAAVVFGADRL
jgi:hypothetical protein